VICSALHSTGLPDHVELPNRLLAPLTDAFIAVAEPHAKYLAAHEGCTPRKICVVPNGVDIERFHQRCPNPALRQEFGLDANTQAVGIVAALRPEKNHEMFLYVAALIRQRLPNVRFLIVGDGLRRAELETLAKGLGVADIVRFLGTRSDIPEVLSVLDVVLLTSHSEANPICVLEAMACEKPVVATRVGSVSETVLDHQTGYLVALGDSQQMAERVVRLLTSPERAAAMGRAAREHVIGHWSVDGMVRGYENLITRIYTAKCGRAPMTNDEIQRTKEIQMAKPE
jgi:glycosyltransferase involved in cell wall biosynthesis